MTTLDLAYVRSQFPAFSSPALEGLSHFENAGGSYACGQVIEAFQRFYTDNKVQPYYPAIPSKTGGEQMDRARRRMAAWLNVSTEEVHFGPSTSQNTYVLAQSLRKHLEPGDEIIVTNQDHEANVGAWRRLEEDGITVLEWRVDPQTGQLHVSELEKLLGERTRMVTFTHCSNIVGRMHPVRSWVDRIHAAGAIAIIDGVSYCPHGLPDVTALGADVYLFSLYKVYGPHLGVMVMREALNAELPNQGHFFNEDLPAARFTPAGPDHAQIAAVNGVIDYFEAVYQHHFSGQDVPDNEKAAALLALFQQHEHTLLKPLLDWLKEQPQIHLIGSSDTENRAPTVSFTVDGHDPAELSQQLADENLGVGDGHFYAYRVIEALGIPVEQGVLRISFVHYTSPQEVERLIATLQRLL